MAPAQGSDLAILANLNRAARTRLTPPASVRFLASRLHQRRTATAHGVPPLHRRGWQTPHRPGRAKAAPSAAFRPRHRLSVNEMNSLETAKSIRHSLAASAAPPATPPTPRRRGNASFPAPPETRPPESTPAPRTSASSSTPGRRSATRPASRCIPATPSDTAPKAARP